MSLDVSQLIDLTRVTLNNLPSGDFEKCIRYQKYHALNQWFKGDKKQIGSGLQIERNIVLDPSGQARHVKLYQKSAINIADIQQKIYAPWCFAETSFSIERREAKINSSPAGFIQLIKSRKWDATQSLADLLEERAWKAPNDSNDTVNPRGIPYWLSKPETSSGDLTGSFAGRTIRFATSGTSTNKGGIDGSLAANAKWRNWVFSYDSVNNEFVQRLRRAFHSTNFQSPMSAEELNSTPMRIYMALEELVAYEDLTSKSNDNLGTDLGKFHGVTVFRRVPIFYAPVLDDDANNVIYGVNHDHFYPFVLEGEWMKQSEPMKDVEQHNVVTVFTDCSYNYFCDNVRHAGFVATNQM